MKIEDFKELEWLDGELYPEEEWGEVDEVNEFWYHSEEIFVYTEKHGVLFGWIQIDVPFINYFDKLDDILKKEDIIKITFISMSSRYNEDQEDIELDLSEIKEFKKFENIFKK